MEIEYLTTTPTVRQLLITVRSRALAPLQIKGNWSLVEHSLKEISVVLKIITRLLYFLLSLTEEKNVSSESCCMPS